MFTIRELNLSDSFNYLASENIFTIAQEQKLWKPDEPFDFTRVYSNGEYASQYYSGRRMWGAFRRIAPSLSLPSEYKDLRYDRMWPWSVKPDEPVTAQDVMSWHRDWYAGTAFDMTKGLAAGPFGTPDRWATNSENVVGHWERSIAIYRTNWVHVQQLRATTDSLPKELAGVTWFGPGAPHYSPFLPVPSGLSRSLTPLMTGMPHQNDPGSMNWACRKIGNICQIRFDKMHALVEDQQHALEAKGQHLVSSAADIFAKSGDIDGLNQIFEDFANEALQIWTDLADDLIFRFSDNTDILNHTEHHDASFGYPDSWLQAVEYQGGPPDPPVETQCPPKCSSQGTVVV